MPPAMRYLPKLSIGGRSLFKSRKITPIIRAANIKRGANKPARRQANDRPIRPATPSELPVTLAIPHAIIPRGIVDAPAKIHPATTDSMLPVMANRNAATREIFTASPIVNPHKQDKRSGRLLCVVSGLKLLDVWVIGWRLYIGWCLYSSIRRRGGR